MEPIKGGKYKFDSSPDEQSSELCERETINRGSPWVPRVYRGPLDESTLTVMSIVVGKLLGCWARTPLNHLDHCTMTGVMRRRRIVNRESASRSRGPNLHHPSGNLRKYSLLIPDQQKLILRHSVHPSTGKAKRCNCRIADGHEVFGGEASSYPRYSQEQGSH